MCELENAILCAFNRESPPRNYRPKLHEWIHIKKNLGVHEFNMKKKDGINVKFLQV